MLFKQLERTGPEQVFVIARNTSGGTISANAPVYFETDAVTDGNAVSQAIGLLGGLALFAGITDASMVDDAYGLVQVYGIRTSCYASAASAGCAVGIPLIPVAGQNYLTDSTSAANTFAGGKVVLAETIGAAAGASAVAQYTVFIRAL